ncbi:hypothetical protein L7F22_050383 [Adiantum nelumboides]|nr:hypothetical protein [Adiantum nelumboides]
MRLNPDVRQLIRDWKQDAGQSVKAMICSPGLEVKKNCEDRSRVQKDTLLLAAKWDICITLHGTFLFCGQDQIQSERDLQLSVRKHNGGCNAGELAVMVYDESSIEIREGGRTRLMALIVSFYFFMSLFLTPLLASIPLWAIGPSLVVVGVLLMRPVMEIYWDDMGEAIPAFLTIILMPLTYSIAYGLLARLGVYLILHVWDSIRQGMHSINVQATRCKTLHSASERAVNTLNMITVVNGSLSSKQGESHTPLSAIHDQYIVQGRPTDDMLVIKCDSVDVVISYQSDIDEETGFSESVHAMHASIAANSNQATCFSKSVCDVDAHLECSLGVDHEENAYATLHAKATILASAIQEDFMSMAAFQDTGDDADVYDADPYVFDVNPDKDYDYGDAYSKGVPDGNHSMIATGDRFCYDDAMEKEIDAIFVMHVETCAIELEGYLNESVKLPEQFMPMYETSNEVSCDDTHKLGGSSKEENMKLMDMLDDALEKFRVPCDKSSEEHPQHMMKIL